MLQVKFLSDNFIITTGHNYSPIVIGLSSEKWYVTLLVDRIVICCRSIVDELSGADESKKMASSAFGSAFAKFKSMDDCGTSANKSASTPQKSGHKNTISQLDVLKNGSGQISEISTSSFDGNLIIWDIKNVLNIQRVSNLQI